MDIIPCTSAQTSLGASIIKNATRFFSPSLGMFGNVKEHMKITNMLQKLAHYSQN
jgi:hypothetical protein